MGETVDWKVYIYGKRLSKKDFGRVMEVLDKYRQFDSLFTPVYSDTRPDYVSSELIASNIGYLFRDKIRIDEAAENMEKLMRYFRRLAWSRIKQIVFWGMPEYGGRYYVIIVTRNGVSSRVVKEEKFARYLRIMLAVEM